VCHGCEDNATKVKAQEIKGGPGAGRGHVDKIDGGAKPD
jgi:hypothetical protein